MMCLANLKFYMLGFAVISMSNVFANTEPFNFSNISSVLSSEHISTKKIMSGTPAAATVIISGASSTISFLETSFYAGTMGGNCNPLTLLGSVTTVDNSPGFPFTDGQTVRLNSQSAYSLATSIGVNPADVRCLSLYMDDGNNNGIDSTDFTDETCFANSCISSQSYNVTWKSNPTSG